MEPEVLEFALRERERVSKDRRSGTNIWWSIRRGADDKLFIEFSQAQACYGALASTNHSWTGTVAIIDHPVAKMASGNAVGTSKEKAIAFADYVVNRSPFRHTYIPEPNPENIVTKGVIVDPTLTPIQVPVIGGTLLRNIWEHSGIIERWYKLKDHTDDETLALIAAHGLSNQGNKWTVYQMNMGHHCFSPDWNGEAVSRMLNDDHSFWDFWMENDDPNLPNTGTAADGASYTKLTLPWCSLGDYYCRWGRDAQQNEKENAEYNINRRRIFNSVPALSVGLQKTVWGKIINQSNVIADLEEYLSQLKEIINGCHAPEYRPKAA